MVARGDVVLAGHESPDEQRRPYLVLTRDEGIPLLNQLLAVPATCTIRGIPTEVHLDVADGMPAERALTLDNLLVVRKSMLTGYVTTLGPAKLAEVCAALRPLPRPATDSASAPRIGSAGGWVGTITTMLFDSSHIATLDRPFGGGGVLLRLGSSEPAAVGGRAGRTER